MEHFDKTLSLNQESEIQYFQKVHSAPELTIVVPTFNECENVPILIDRLRAALTNVNWEVIFVDDNSPDGTAEVVRNIGTQDQRVRCIKRIGRRGLSGACLEGFLSSQASFVAVIDGDLQHDETRLAVMLGKLQSSNFDLIVASRYLEGGSSSSFTTWRSRFSRWANLTAKYSLGVKLSDPMSGFFMLRRSVIEDVAPFLSTQGFKILLDIVATTQGKLRIHEIPYSFQGRKFGESKLDARVALDFFALTLGKLTSNVISLRFLMYCLVGLLGLGVHMLLLRFCIFAGMRFEIAQTLTTFLIIALNFSMNNAFTYRDQRLNGRRFIVGLIRFEIICSVSVIANVGVASWIYHSGNGWWLAGLGGAMIGVVWNYVLSATLVWKTR
jgi:dolichol-phosphate mannosyltransferase